jgi:hypothetical protein
MSIWLRYECPELAPNTIGKALQEAEGGIGGGGGGGGNAGGGGGGEGLGGATI